MTNAQILNDFLHRVWIRGDMDVVDDIFAPDVEAAGLMPDMKLTPEDFKTMVLAMLNMVTIREFTVVMALSDGDWVTAMIRIRAQSQINTAMVDTTAQTTARFEGGKIVEAYNHFDFLALFQQLELIPPDAMVVCLSGESLS
ncbi:ester cyclase [Oceaniglobus trochenteri]|uniref:ester cyclase n=1 Tax=Oceaniglobus trochenteri TaxID=2763260 RepID=UPI001CFF7571|nr:ester cyclase [Oceaniglobus trochenteri]